MDGEGAAVSRLTDPWQRIPEAAAALEAFEDARRWWHLMDRLDWVAAVFDPVHGFERDEFNWDYASDQGAKVIEEVLAQGGLPDG
jgi:hypothetical protein